MTNENIPNKVQMAIDAAPKQLAGKVITKEAIDEFINIFKPMLVTKENIKLARKMIEEEYYIEMEGDLSVMSDDEDHEDWYNTSTGLPIDGTGRDQHYWEHYKKYLLNKRKLGPNAINEIDSVTNQILSKLVDPRNEKDKWDKRGLVMGSVQSGKTGNYTGLIAKAIDSGYKFVIVLSGIHNDLRAQTQLRINDELLGYDMAQLEKSSAIGSGNRVGVGKIFPKHRGRDIQTLTTSDADGDFKTTTAKLVSPVLNGKHTYVLVIKKHVTVLENLIKWLKSYEKTIRNVPMLLIDDECDQASIDTKKHTEHDEDGNQTASGTRTNRDIRLLLNTFDKSAYVGYTATPFANIFIKSDGKNVELGDDLFPKNFIFSLKRPSSYIGPEEFFGLKGKSKGLKEDDDDLKENDDGLKEDDDGLKEDDDGSKEDDDLPLQRGAEDAKDIYPPKQKKNDTVTKLPSTLQHAVKSYLLTLAARKIRKTSNIHSSMLIHVSRFTNIQNQTADLVLELVKNYVARINATDELLEDFKKIWEEDFMKTTTEVMNIAKASSKPKKWGEMDNISWDKILKTLPTVVGHVKVKKLNGKSDEILDYKTHADNHGTKAEWEKRGLHTIVIGGNKLSRGLTLEGLTVSYYLRSSNMYDTLMQMGRWFGYRNGYLDLCRIYATNEIFTNFGLIALAEKDLREQFTKMAHAKKTPKEFGLYVLQSPGRLIVTNRGKSRHSTNLNISFKGSGPEITRFMPSQRLHNWNALTEFIEQLDKNGSTEKNTHNIHWKNVPREIIRSFLGNYSGHVDQQQTTSALQAFIKDQDDASLLKEWDVVCIKNVKKKPQEERYITTSSQKHTLHVVQRKASDYDANKLSVKRIGVPRDEMLDFDEVEVEAIKAKNKADNKILTGADIREWRDGSRGLLLIYLIADKEGKIHPYGGTKDKHKSDKPYYGYLVSFPDKGTFKTTAIVANGTWMNDY
jgi:hypothetical protein